MFNFMRKLDFLCFSNTHVSSSLLQPSLCVWPQDEAVTGQLPSWRCSYLGILQLPTASVLESGRYNVRLGARELAFLSR